MFASQLSSRATPTADLYFANAMRDALAPQGRVRRAAPTVFETDEAVLVMRHDAGARMARHDRRRLIYLLDDAVFAGLYDASLPLSYRMKLWAVECAAARRLAPRADAIVVSAPEVAEALPRALRPSGVEICELAPYWSEALPDLDHFDLPSPWRLGFTGAQTHRAGLRLVARAIAPLLRDDPGLRLHLAANHALPWRLRGAPGLRAEPATRWSDYRAALVCARRHVALYPVADTPFGRARSINKLIEHALLGAAPIYSETWPRAREAVIRGAGIAAALRPADWTEAVAALRADPEKARVIASAAQAFAREMNRPESQRALWTRLLGL